MLILLEFYFVVKLKGKYYKINKWNELIIIFGGKYFMFYLN